MAVIASTDYNRMKEVKELDDSKIGVKGLSNSGVTAIPKFFIQPPETLSTLKSSSFNIGGIPVIDLSNINSPKLRPNIVSQIREAAKTWAVNKDELMQMVRFGAEMVFCSKDSTITNEDIDQIIAKGEEATAELDAKMKKFAEDAIKFKMDDSFRNGDLYDFDDEKIISNGEYRSVEHRVLANSMKEPRILVVEFFSLHKKDEIHRYGPFPELLTAEKPALYRNFSHKEFHDNFFSKGLDSKSFVEKLTIPHE
ncbi:ISWI chromatin-remodeling complex ATPase CHR11 [Camellia lanceoleosa]|uniref:ISWI chromatin-remodeling complex ATPase CHR11 n=1 Tax=Camellia lanceoleosa TaxID=1840588 RepID=A0ACC0HTB6_9ERIC|nr:ISWI chromatin-remodeling complex ATPase CHR11 [Camellia lanceoleosa]